MPEMDGVETLNNLRSIEYLSLGFNEYIPKPINLEVMDKVVHKTF